MSKPKKINVPWTDVLNSSVWYTAYKEHIDNELKRYIFVPSDSNGVGMSTAILSCQQVGMIHVTSGEWKAFQIVIKFGIDAGQEIEVPCIEIIPVK